jgi:hypothetical protein
MTLPRLAAPLLALWLLAAACAPASAQAGDPSAPDPSADPSAAGANTTESPAAAAPSDPCTQPGRNVQCTAFGSAAMDSQREIKGDPINLDADIWLNSNLADQGARWILFSVRNVTGEGSEPVSISLLKFATPSGEVVTTRVDHDKANEIDLWVDVLDTPVGTPITLSVQVGSSERGAYRLEVLVLAFDRGYETLKDPGGTEYSLFTSTLLGVNKETGQISNAGGGSLLEGKKTPGLGLPILAATVGIAAALRRRAA